MFRVGYDPAIQLRVRKAHASDNAATGSASYIIQDRKLECQGRRVCDVMMTIKFSSGNSSDANLLGLEHRYYEPVNLLFLKNEAKGNC
jgi:hypothetical protein